MKVNRFYLEINSLQNLNEFILPDQNLFLEKVNPPDLELNKFFYKNVGKNHRWIDRLAWDNLKWISYLENENVQTYVLKLNQDLVGFLKLYLIKTLIARKLRILVYFNDYIGKNLRLSII